MGNNLKTDVLIVGGGPAGASTALGLLAYSRLRVLIIEGSDLNTIRVGEQVDPSLFDLLTYLGIGKESFGEDSFIRGYNTLSAWGSSQLMARSSLFDSREECYQLDRGKFDLHLLGKAHEKGAAILPRAKCVGLQQTPDTGWTVQVKHQVRGALSVEARFLVDATGRNSSVARQLGIQTVMNDQLVAVGAFFQAGNANGLRHELLLETVEEGWWYSATLPNGQLVTTLFTDADIVKEKQLHKAENWKGLLVKTVHAKRRMANSVASESLWVRSAHSKRVESTEQPNFIAVGDAAASFDPVSSLGIGFAVSSGCNAARAIIQAQEGRDSSMEVYRRAIDHIFTNYLQTKARYYAQEKRWPNAPFWKRRLN